MPIGIYTIPEIASIGSTRNRRARYRGPIVGRAPFTEIAKARSPAPATGLLKLFSDPSGERLLGVQIVGEMRRNSFISARWFCRMGDHRSVHRHHFQLSHVCRSLSRRRLDIQGQRRKRRDERSSRLIVHPSLPASFDPVPICATLPSAGLPIDGGCT